MGTCVSDRGDDKRQRSSNIEDEFVLSDSTTASSENQQHPDYLNRKVSIPSLSNFKELNVTATYRGKCVTWGQYKSAGGDLLLGNCIQ